jgi:ABC-type multidrug transport system fused ATPase/permease subunit
VKLPALDAPRVVAMGAFPAGLFAYIRRISGRDQLALCALSVVVFLLATAPVELQRRVVNVALHDRDFPGVALLCSIYVGVTLTAGLLKLVLHVYRGWVSENAVRQLRAVVYDLAAECREGGGCDDPKEEGVGISVILAEAEHVGGFVGISVSEPVLQLGILLSVFGYMVVLNPWMAVLSFLLFSPQLVFVPRLQHRINERARERIQVLREVSGDLIDDWSQGRTRLRRPLFLERIDRVLALNMRIFKLKYAMNFLINEVHHIGIVAILLVGSWLALGGSIEIGTVVAFISGLGRVKEPWGDLVSYFREMAVARVKYGLVAGAFAKAPIPAAPPARAA